MSANRYTLTDPCADCPFRSDKPFRGLRRAPEIAESIEAGQEFYCHKTLDYTDGEPEVVNRTRACAGAAIVVENGGHRPSQLRQITERLGLPTAPLNMDAPVYDSLEDWLDAMDANS